MWLLGPGAQECTGPSARGALLVRVHFCARSRDAEKLRSFFSERRPQRDVRSIGGLRESPPPEFFVFCSKPERGELPRSPQVPEAESLSQQRSQAPLPERKVLVAPYTGEVKEVTLRWHPVQWEDVSGRYGSVKGRNERTAEGCVIVQEGIVPTKQVCFKMTTGLLTFLVPCAPDFSRV